MYHDADAISIVVIAAVALIQMTMTTAFMLPTTQPRLAAPSRDSTTRIFLEGKEGGRCQHSLSSSFFFHIVLVLPKPHTTNTSFSSSHADLSDQRLGRQYD